MRIFRGFRWLDLLAIGVMLWIVFAVLRALPDDSPRGRVEVLRAVFERASTQCYDEFGGAELRACLAGVMDAHLHALGDDDNEHGHEVARAGLIRGL